jgi:hypothetical protein
MRGPAIGAAERLTPRLLFPSTSRAPDERGEEGLVDDGVKYANRQRIEERGERDGE